MLTVEGCVNPKLHVSMHEGYSTQDESMHAGLASMHVKYKTQDEWTRREDVSMHDEYKTQDESTRRVHVSIHAVLKAIMSRSKGGCVDS